ncbi:1-phosphatidylinositol 4,5-bisphosphate phosphodiesterase gamma-2-like [Erpetoichthys calabaricus]|uniref:1-phosphatidylinositol 4,5-bisphosphate phosphodiesterase gamma-2-like n=1 Tax=Erpetoichthys calabaricus TaxID=27687 RepID=UPI00223471F3|nr:1-phosphatidylinositol 4,5-bisphosphate phosphodiesterase gamma-2-like [Erpetoichthys calabaricus]
MHFVFTLNPSLDAGLPIDFATKTVEEQFEWYQMLWKIMQKNLCQQFKITISEKKDLVAAEMSDLAVYCQPKIKDLECFDKYDFKEIRSFAENKAPIGKNCASEFFKYNCKALSRIYPKGERLDSSNFNPCPLWKCGCQMVALNFQSPDKYLQISNALFSLNGKCGYVLKPEKLRNNQYKILSKNGTDKWVIHLKVIAARHLPKSRKAIISPFVVVELCEDNSKENKYKTLLIKENGLNPVWKTRPEIVEFTVCDPHCAFLHFEVNEEDVLSEPALLAQATFPVVGLKTGYRSVPLKNGFSEDIELASLLVFVEVKHSRI